MVWAMCGFAMDTDRRQGRAGGTSTGPSAGCVRRLRCAEARQVSLPGNDSWGTCAQLLALRRLARLTLGLSGMTKRPPLDPVCGVARLMVRAELL